MTVKRIVANISTDGVSSVASFYSDLFGLNVVMNHGWIVTLANDAMAPVQISVASQGGNGTPVPDLSIEVDDVDAVYANAMRLGVPVTYELTDEPWGVRRFFVRDPAGKLLNIMAHLDQTPPGN